MKFWKYLFSQRGEGETVDPTAAQPPAAEPWYKPAEVLKTSDPEIWDSLTKTTEKDFPSFVKSAIHHQKMIGRSIVPPGPNAKPEEVKAFRQKIYGTGVFKAPPEAPDKYDVKIPDGMKLDDEALGKLRTVAHKHDLSQDAINELTGLYFEHHKDLFPMLDEVSKLVPVLKLTKEESQKQWDERLKESGHTPEAVKAVVGRYASQRFTAEQIASLGDYGNHPIVLELLYESALNSGEQFPDLAPGANGTAVDADFAEMQAAMRDPKHPDHAKWKSSDPEFVKRREELYKKKYGYGPVTPG